MALTIKNPTGLSDHALLGLTYHEDDAIRREAIAETARRERAAIAEGTAAVVSA